MSSLATGPPRLCSITGLSPICQFTDAKYQTSGISIILFIFQKTVFHFGLLLVSSSVKTEFSLVSDLFLKKSLKL